jgi:hypothetical protein
VPPELLHFQVEQLAIDVRVTMNLIRAHESPNRLWVIPVTVHSAPLDREVFQA